MLDLSKGCPMIRCDSSEQSRLICSGKESSIAQTGVSAASNASTASAIGRNRIEKIRQWRSMQRQSL